MPEHTEPERFLKIMEAAEYLGVSRRTIYNLLKGGDLQRIDLNLKQSAGPWKNPEDKASLRPHPRIPLSSLNAYINRNSDPSLQ